MMQQSSLRDWCVSQKFSSWLNVYQLDSVLHKEFTLDVAEKIASLKNMSAEDVAEVTSNNAMQFFGFKNQKSTS